MILLCMRVAMVRRDYACDKVLSFACEHMHVPYYMYMHVAGIVG